jgi:predicted HTH domain antitoxin
VDPARTVVTVPVDLPLEAIDVDGRSPGEIAGDLRLLWIIDRVRCGRVSVGKGAQLAAMDRWSFVRALGEHGVSAISYPVEDLQKDVATLESL